MIHYLLVGIEITVGLVLWLGAVVVLGAVGWAFISRESASGREEVDPDAGVLSWAVAVVLWLLAGGVFFGTMFYVAGEADKDCSDKGGHLVTRGKVTECVVVVHGDTER